VSDGEGEEVAHEVEEEARVAAEKEMGKWERKEKGKAKGKGKARQSDNTSPASDLLPEILVHVSKEDDVSDIYRYSIIFRTLEISVHQCWYPDNGAILPFPSCGTDPISRPSPD
jgi:hypothetical protein